MSENDSEAMVLKGITILPISGVCESILDAAESGKTTIFSKEADVAEDMVEFSVAGILDTGIVRRLAVATGTKTVLAVRVIASDSLTSSSEVTISDEIFGTVNDLVNMKSQYEACSNGQLIFQPFTGTTSSGTTVLDGVTTVKIDMNVNGVEDSSVRVAVLDAANNQLGNLQDHFDYVMLCLPPGTSGSW